ncbi:MAG: histidine phosphatase family protein [Bryobacterales bacterium]|nr:histidine phosphatase family protein [Bryobacterales bacterium]
MRTLYLIRHAEPEDCGVLLGRTDSLLTARGQLAAAQLSSLRVQTVFSSPLRRAVDTALHLKPPIVLPELAEIDFGQWDGLYWKDIQRRWPDLVAAKEKDWFGVTPPGGEPWDAFVARLERMWPRILAAKAPIAVVAHAAVNSVLSHWLGGPEPLGFHQHYCEVLTFSLPHDRT